MDYGNIFPIVEYYKKVVHPVNPRKYWVKNDKMMVCPLHDDVNPSMGVIRAQEGKETFHCFGCNAWGNVVELHQRVSKRLFKKYLTEDAALRELCRLFGVDYEEVSGASKEEDIFDADLRQDLAMQKAMGNFDISDFRNMIMEGKALKKGAAYFNTVVMVMIDSLKE